MRIEVGMVRSTCRISLAMVSGACAVTLLAPTPDWAAPFMASAHGVRLVGAYILTLMAFAAFPKGRRTDLAKATVLGGICLEILRRLLGHDLHFTYLFAEAAGAYAVLIPSFLERFRALTRSDPSEPLSLVYPNDRRRKRRRSAKATSSSPLKLSSSMVD